MPNPVIRRRIGRNLKYRPLSIDYFNRAGISNSNEKKWWNHAVVEIENAGLVSIAVALWPCSPTSYGASLHNAMSSSFLLSATAAPSFAQTGWTGDGATQYLKTGLVSSTSLQLNSNTLWYYSRTNNTSGIDFGAVVSASQSHYARARTAGNVAQLSAYNNAITGSNSDSSGYFFFSVTGASARNIRRNNASLVSDATAVGGTRTNIEHFLLSRNNQGTPDTFSTREICGAGAFSTALTAAQSDVFWGIMSTYNANVIPGGR